MEGAWDKYDAASQAVSLSWWANASKQSEAAASSAAAAACGNVCL